MANVGQKLYGNHRNLVIGDEKKIYSYLIGNTWTYQQVYYCDYKVGAIVITAWWESMTDVSTDLFPLMYTYQLRTYFVDTFR